MSRSRQRSSTFSSSAGNAGSRSTSLYGLLIESPRFYGERLGRQLAADLGERALLGVVKRGEGAGHPRRVVWEQSLDQLDPLGGDPEHHRPTVAGQPPA